MLPPYLPIVPAGPKMVANPRRPGRAPVEAGEAVLLRRDRSLPVAALLTLLLAFLRPRSLRPSVSRVSRKRFHAARIPLTLPPSTQTGPKTNSPEMISALRHAGVNVGASSSRPVLLVNSASVQLTFRNVPDSPHELLPRLVRLPPVGH